MKRVKKIFIWIAGLLLLYSFLGFLVIPSVIKSVLPDRLGKMLHRDVFVENVKMNPFALSITVEGFRINDASGERDAIAIEKLYANTGIQAIFKKTLIFKEINIEKPFVSILRDKQGGLNILSLIPNTAAGEPESKEEQVKKKEEAAPLTIKANVNLSEGKIIFRDLKENFETKIDSLNVSLRPLTTSKDQKSILEISMKTESNEAIGMKSRFSMYPFLSEGTLNISKAVLKKYAPYYRKNINFDIEEGNLDLLMKYTYETEKTEGLTLFNIGASLSALRLKRDGGKNDFLRIPEVTINNSKINIAKQELTIGNFTTQNGFVSLKRFSDGRLNAQMLIPPQSTIEEKQTTVDGEDSKEPWIVNLKKATAENYTLLFEDHTPSQPLTLELGNINLRAEDFSNAFKNQGKISFSLKEKRGGSFNTDGTVGINPVSTKLNLNVSDFSVLHFQPYISDKLDLMVSDGKISATVTIHGAESTPGNVTAKCNGTIKLSDFSSVNKLKGTEFFTCKSFHLKNLDAGYNPNYLKIKEIGLYDFYTDIIINPDQTINIANIVKKDQQEETVKENRTIKAAEPPKEAHTLDSITIETISLCNGHLNFNDKFIKPNYTAKNIELCGTISRLSSLETIPADVDIKGSLDKLIPLEITGKINPLAKDFFADLKIKFENIGLCPLTPYCGKYLGHEIDKGKLFLNLRYTINKNKIDSENKILIDQFTFGKHVESPDAVQLPVKLAIGLLKNRSGKIELDVPVTGDIDDPDFSIGYFIFKIICNIIEKAVTSPFSLLGSVFGGGEELGYVEFPYGSAAITEDNIEKMNILNTALHERPLLKLDITGYIDVGKDRAVLIQTQLAKKVKQAKLKDIIDKGLPAKPLEKNKIEPDEYKNYLIMAYESEEIPEAKKGKDQLEKMSSAEIEKLLMKHIEITDDDLRQLAYDRATKVRNYILDSGKVERERVFLVDPESLNAPRKDKTVNSRVDFSLK